jgi:hypothetical protein
LPFKGNNMGHVDLAQATIARQILPQSKEVEYTHSASLERPSKPPSMPFAL